MPQTDVSDPDNCDSPTPGLLKKRSFWGVHRAGGEVVHRYFSAVYMYAPELLPQELTAASEQKEGAGLWGGQKGFLRNY